MVSVGCGLCTKQAKPKVKYFISAQLLLNANILFARLLGSYYS